MAIIAQSRTYARRAAPLLVVVAVAAVLRFPGLGVWPPGLYHDEAYYGLDAVAVLEGARPVFFPANYGREPLFIYLVAGSVALFGQTPEAVRGVAALLGTLTVGATYLWARTWFGPRVALWAALLTAITIWHLNFSRVGIRAVSLPLLSALLLWQLGLAWQHRRLRYYLAAGVLAGGLLYTYLAARFVWGALAVIALYMVWQHRSRVQWSAVGIAGATAVIIALPLGLYFWQHQDEFAQRAAQISVFSPAVHQGDPPGTLARHILHTLGMFFVQGDFIPRHNVPLRPVFDPLLGIAFVIGVIICMRAWRRPACAATLLWIAVLALPTVLAEDAPHFLRSSGMLPVLFAVPALALERGRRWLAARTRPALATGGVAAILGISLVWGLYDYGRHVRSAEAYFQFEAGAVELAQDLNHWRGRGYGADDAAKKGIVWLDRRLWDGWASVRFLAAPGPDLHLFNTASRLPAFDEATLVALWPYADHSEVLAGLSAADHIWATAGAWERGDLEPEAKQLYVLVGTNWPHAPQHAKPIRFGTMAELLGYDLERNTDGWKVRLHWRALDDAPGAYTGFVHAVGPDGLIAQHDGPAALGYYSTQRWRTGQAIVDERRLKIRAGIPNEDLSLHIGWYDPETQVRLPVVTVDGELIGDALVLPVAE